jgi:hypothetical protein
VGGGGERQGEEEEGEGEHAGLAARLVMTGRAGRGEV